MLDTFLDTPAEVHAVWHGFTRSIYTKNPRAPPGEPEHPDAKAEEPYFRLGWVLGTVVQLGAIVVAGWLATQFGVTLP